MPTLEDYETLATAYQEQQRKIEELANEQKKMAAKIAVKDDAIQRQTEDIKKLDAELLWTKAALEQADKRSAEIDKQIELQERAAQLQAETDSLRKRLEARAEAKIHTERNQILADMLPLADHLELALKHVHDQEGHSQEGGREPTSIDAQFVDNIEATLKAFLNTLKRYDVTPIDAHGQPFDPELHEAIGTIDKSDSLPNHVAQVIQTGYKNENTLIRPARVLVQEEPNKDL